MVLNCSPYLQETCSRRMISWMTNIRLLNGEKAKYHDCLPSASVHIKGVFTNESVISTKWAPCGRNRGAPAKIGARRERTAWSPALTSSFIAPASTLGGPPRHAMVTVFSHPGLPRPSVRHLYFATTLRVRIYLSIRSSCLGMNSTRLPFPPACPPLHPPSRNHFTPL